MRPIIILIPIVVAVRIFLYTAYPHVFITANIYRITGLILVIVMKFSIVVAYQDHFRFKGRGAVACRVLESAPCGRRGAVYSVDRTVWNEEG